MTESSFRRLLLRFALVPIFSLCGFVAVLGFKLHEISARRATGSHATGVILQSDLLLESLIDEETGIRGYLATRNELFLQPYREASGRFASERIVLRKLASSDPTLAMKMNRIDQGYTRLDAINKALLRPSLSGDAISDLLGRQKQEMDALRTDFIDLNNEQNNIRESSRSELTRIFGTLPLIGVGGAVLIALLLIFHGSSLFREITVAYKEQLYETGVQRDSLQTILHSIGDAVMVCDQSGHITMLNKAAETLTGWSNEQAIGRPVPEVFRIVNEYTRLPIENPADRARHMNAVVALENHTCLIRKDGSEIPIDDSAAPIRDRGGAVSGVVLVFRSVAERRQAAKLIRQNQERLNSIFNTGLEYIGILSVDGRVVDCNRASLEFAGNTREDVVGRFFWDCPWFIHTDGMPESVRAAVEGAIAGNVARTEMALIRPSGETVHFDFSLTPVFDADGKVIYLVPEARDISELKRAELALIQSEKLAAVGRLASSIAHEINNPLEAVTNLLYLAQGIAESPEVKELLTSADRELRRVSGIANKTLRFHRQSSNPEPILASDLFTSVLGIYEGRIRNSHIAVEATYRFSEPIVCFAGDVRQVLSNLIGNAIDAIGNRGGRLLVRSHHSTDWVTGRKGVMLTVADTGSGVSPEHLKQIFEPFFTTKENAGTGLGLWISREVASHHGGTLKVRSSNSTNHSGTTFRFFLPLS